MLLASALAGCGSPPPSRAVDTTAPSVSPPPSLVVSGVPSPAGPALPVEVLQTGFSTFADGRASFGAILRNPNPDLAVVRANVTIDFLDAGDTFLTGAEVPVTILPGQTTAIAGQASGAGMAAMLTIRPPEDDTALLARTPSGEGFDVGQVRTAFVNGTWVTTGRLTSRFATGQSFVELIAIHRDRDGSIIGGGNGGIEAIAPGAEALFEIVDDSPYDPGIISTDVYWQVTR